MARNLYTYYEKSFLNVLLENAFYTLDCLDEKSSAYNYLFNVIRYGAEIEFNFSKYDPKSYNPKFYQRYMKIIKLPSTEEIVQTSVEAAIKATVAEITESKSYIIGNTITRIPRKIKHILNRRKK